MDTNLIDISNKFKNSFVQTLLTDSNAIKIAYANWKAGKTQDIAVFDLVFLKNPFNGEFTIFAGLNDCLNFIQDFKFSKSDIDYLKKVLPEIVESEFFDYLSTLSTNDVIIYALDEGTVAFPRIPLLIVEGPFIISQLLETALLNLISYASLITTNAARLRLITGDNIKLLEFGLRRAQGPDGGGFDGSSNVLAGKLFNIPIKGTMAHAFVASFSDNEEIQSKYLIHKTEGYEKDFIKLCFLWRSKLCDFLKIRVAEVSNGELLSFISFSLAYPNDFVALVDTYDVIRSGLINFSAVALALFEMGYKAVGIRIDSGDLGHLSNKAREIFNNIAKEYCIPWFKNVMIIASSDINEESILSVYEHSHQIDAFGIGTHLVTCQKQPSLRCLYKLVDINGYSKIKLCENIDKITVPGKKNAFRLFGADGMAICDLLQFSSEDSPIANKKVLCCHPFHEAKRAWVMPTNVQSLYKMYWNKGKLTQQLPNLMEIRNRVQLSMKMLRSDHKRILNPTPYKVSLSDALYRFMHVLWCDSALIGELS